MRTTMDAEAATQSPVVFHLTGRRQGADLEAIDGLALRPALLARYRDLTRLRYDFPLVLVSAGAEGGPVQPLSRVIDRLLQRIAPAGIESEKLRKLVLRVEREIRTLAAQGATGLLSELWDRAADLLPASAEHGPGESVKIARAALDVDGDVIDCGATTAYLVLDHLWSAVREDKTKRFRAIAIPLAVKLEDILRADFARSAAGRDVERLSAGIGAPHRDLFDFAAMSRLLPKSSPREALTQSRRRRIEWALAALTGQRFFAMSSGYVPPRRAPYSFRFDSCAAALASYRARLPEMAELVKALSVGELEVDGRYVESVHDELFAGFGAESLRAEDLAMFPDYLVSLEDRGEVGHGGVMEALSSGAPLKVLANIDDLHDDAPGHVCGAQLASMATGLDGVFVLQATSSSLYRMRARVERGLTYAGPALFCVYSGAGARHATLPAYLGAAAALESRAFPCFTVDPAGGSDLASRFSLDGNPQPDRDWPVHALEFADAEFGRMRQEVAFTLADFLSCDPRNARHFARVASARWNDRMVPAAQRMDGADGGADDVPFVLAVDADGTLMRLILDDAMVVAARRCLDGWHRLQELGGVHSSHAARLLAREKAEWEKQKQAEIASLKAAAPSSAPIVMPAEAAPAAPAPAPAQPVEAAEPARAPDEPYIETARCSSCNECIQINDRMFKYNDNKQAVIADLAAGTYRQLVEAAESCQLSIIHPGKPRDPNEPGLDELIQRAEPFA
ncbi:MAG TPA: hypothetical protein VEK73_11805 [Xanthobacteraceae bacterium]|nr:hypothetical protein [Xanthobacteraceae bacterium]